MGEVFHALQHLNRTMKLGLSGEQLMRAEGSFKSAFAQASNPDPQFEKLVADPMALSQEYEFVTVLQPRARKLEAEELREMADKAVRTNLRGVKLGAVRINAVQMRAAQTAKRTTKAAKKD